MPRAALGLSARGTPGSNLKGDGLLEAAGVLGTEAHAHGRRTTGGDVPAAGGRAARVGRLLRRAGAAGGPCGGRRRRGGAVGICAVRVARTSKELEALDAALGLPGRRPPDHLQGAKRKSSGPVCVPQHASTARALLPS